MTKRRPNIAQYAVNFIGPRQEYVPRGQNPVKPARRATRIAPHIAAMSETGRSPRSERLGLAEDRALIKGDPVHAAYALIEKVNRDLDDGAISRGLDKARGDGK